MHTVLKQNETEMYTWLLTTHPENIYGARMVTDTKRLSEYSHYADVQGADSRWEVWGRSCCTYISLTRHLLFSPLWPRPRLMPAAFYSHRYCI